MALLALLSALLLGGLRMSRAAVSRGEIATERLLRAELAFAVIRREIERAAPLPLASATEPRIAFTGDGQSVVFVAPPGAYLALGGEEITWLAIEPGTDGARIVLRYRPLDRAAAVWPPVLDAARRCRRWCCWMRRARRVRLFRPRRSRHRHAMADGMARRGDAADAHSSQCCGLARSHRDTAHRASRRNRILGGRRALSARHATFPC